MNDVVPLRTSRVRGLPMVELCGDLDSYNASFVKERLFKLIENGDADLLINLNRVDFVDSVGLGVLVAVHHRVLSHGGTMRVLCNNRAIWHVFEITGLQRVFPVYKDDVALMTSLDAK